LDEKRKHARFATRLRVWCEGDDVTLFGRVGNLGEGGLFVHTGTPFAQGARARVRLKDLGTGGEVQAQATVVWARRPGASFPAGMGLKFEPSDEHLAEEIRRLLRFEHGNKPGLR
jgi:uncharacterized protein (TIGR02266 family)